MGSAGKGDRTRTWTLPELRERWEETFGRETPGGETCPSCGQEAGVEVTEVQEESRQLLCVSCGHEWSGEMEIPPPERNE